MDRKPISGLFNQPFTIRRPTEAEVAANRSAFREDMVVIVGPDNAPIAAVYEDDLFDGDGMRFELDA